MILERADVERLIPILKKHCPVDTGNLKNFGIQGVQFDATLGLFVIQIGFPEGLEGTPPSETYAYFTEFTNRSKGWVDRAIKEWWFSLKTEIKLRMEGDLVDVDLY